MKTFEQAKALAKEMDSLYPNFLHYVGIHYNIVRVKKPLEDHE